jgi:hypothetical protein
MRWRGGRTKACLMGAALALASPAAAQTAPSAEIVRGGMYDASDPAAIVAFMQSAGFGASLTTAPDGDPMIRGRLSRTDYAIQFYECENGVFCNSMQLVAQAPRTADLEAVNAFNLRWRYARATYADGALRLQMDVNLDAGVTADNLRDSLDIWRQLLEIFERDLLGFT